MSAFHSLYLTDSIRLLSRRQSAYFLLPQFESKSESFIAAFVVYILLRLSILSKFCIRHIPVLKKSYIPKHKWCMIRYTYEGDESIWSFVTIVLLTFSSPTFWNGLFHLLIWMSIILKKGCRVDKNLHQNAKQYSGKTEKAISVDYDEKVRYDSSHLDLHCLPSLFFYFQRSLLRNILLAQQLSLSACMEVVRYYPILPYYWSFKSNGLLVYIIHKNRVPIKDASWSEKC